MAEHPEIVMENPSSYYVLDIAPSYGEPKYLYALNGEVKPKCTGIRNRLLK